MKRIYLLPAVLFCAMAATVSAFADEAPFPDDPVRHSSSPLVPILIAAVVIIAAAAAIWFYLRKKKSQK